MKLRDNLKVSNKFFVTMMKFDLKHLRAFAQSNSFCLQCSRASKVDLRRSATFSHRELLSDHRLIMLRFSLRACTHAAYCTRTLPRVTSVTRWPTRTAIRTLHSHIAFTQAHQETNATTYTQPTQASSTSAATPTGDVPEDVALSFTTVASVSSASSNLESPASAESKVGAVAAPAASAPAEEAKALADAQKTQVPSAAAPPSTPGDIPLPTPPSAPAAPAAAKAAPVAEPTSVASSSAREAFNAAAAAAAATGLPPPPVTTHAAPVVTPAKVPCPEEQGPVTPIVSQSPPAGFPIPFPPNHLLWMANGTQITVANLFLTPPPASPTPSPATAAAPAIAANPPAAAVAPVAPVPRFVVLVGFVGAYLSVCQNQLPSFSTRIQEFRKRGVHSIYGVSVNDHAVLKSFAEDVGLDLEAMPLIADQDATFVRGLNLAIDLSAAGMGVRAKRFVMLVREGVVEDCWVEANPGDLTVSAAENVLKRLPQTVLPPQQTTTERVVAAVQAGMAAVGGAAKTPESASKEGIPAEKSLPPSLSRHWMMPSLHRCHQMPRLGRHLLQQLFLPPIMLHRPFR